MSEHTPPIVHVSTESVAALSEPTFIIEVDGKYYVTLAVWEYDPRAPNLDERQRHDIAELADIYEGLTRDRQSHPAVQWARPSHIYLVQSSPQK